MENCYQAFDWTGFLADNITNIISAMFVIITQQAKVRKHVNITVYVTVLDPGLPWEARQPRLGPWLDF